MSMLERSTKETRVKVDMRAGKGDAKIDTGLPFLDHMMTALARYASLDLDLTATGDLRHHVIEDVAITIGEAFHRILPANCARYGDHTIPMDDALVHVSVDTGGRAHYAGHLPSSLYDHWMRSFAMSARITLHVRVLAGNDRHHIVEASFKALGFALHDSLVDTGAVFSTKGAVILGVD